jgi:hypothetical protein
VVRNGHGSHSKTRKCRHGLQDLLFHGNDDDKE